MRALVQLVDSGLRAALIALFALMTGCVIWQVASRYVLGAPSTLTDEIARFLFVWLAMLGAAYVLGRRRHLAINFFADLPPGGARRALAILLTGLIALFAAAAMIYGGGRMTLDVLASGQVSPGLRAPMGLFYIALPISGAIMLVYCLETLAEALGPEARGPNDPKPEE